MKKLLNLVAFFGLLGATEVAFAVPEKTESMHGDVRTIHLRQDDAQIHFLSRVYQMKFVSARELLPFVNSALKRYNQNSSVKVVDDVSSRGALLVSTGENFLPYVDKIIEALDRPPKGRASGNNYVKSTGVVRMVYTPSYRAAADFAQILNSTLSSSSGYSYINPETNTIIWRDQRDAAERTLSWVKRLDRPLPQVRVRMNYYEIRDSDLKDWGLDYLAWKNGPGVNLLNVGYNAGEVVVNELLEGASQALMFTSTWGMGGFFTAPQFDMSFVRCLQQSGNTNAVAHAALVMISTPVNNEIEYQLVKGIQEKYPDNAPFIYRMNMTPEYNNIAKNTLGRSFVGKSFYEDEYGVKHADPPVLEIQLVNPFICLGQANDKLDEDGFLPDTAEFYKSRNALHNSGGVIFDFSIYFKAVVERGNTGAELSNNAMIAGSTSLGFGNEKILGIYEKENDVEQTVGLPVLSRIPVLKYLFSTVTSIKERTYVVVTAEAQLETAAQDERPGNTSISTNIERRVEDPFRFEKKKKVEREYPLQIKPVKGDVVKEVKKSSQPVKFAVGEEIIEVKNND